ncbi:hypothetical protein IDVR_07970 [Intrasporangium sp. DVR]
MTNVLLGLAVVSVIGVAFAIGGLREPVGDEPFGGSDAQAMALVESAHPDYEAWVEPFFRPGSSQIESGLFALQAGIGGIAIGYVVGRLHERRRVTTTGRTEPGPRTAQT